MSRPKTVMRLLWESRDKCYDKQTRNMYYKLYRYTNKLSNKLFKEFMKNSYDFCLGYYYGVGIKVPIKENEFETLQAVVENIKEGYYK